MSQTFNNHIYFWSTFSCSKMNLKSIFNERTSSTMRTLSEEYKMRWRGGCGNLRGGIWRGGLRASEDRTSIFPKVEFERGCWKYKLKECWNIIWIIFACVQCTSKGENTPHSIIVQVVPWLSGQRTLPTSTTWWVEQVRDYGAATIFSTICK